jgi:mannitol-1-/sugar-/sorbitol-6-phosphatase
MMLLSAEAFIFDVDATLVDTTTVIDGIWQVWCERYNQDFEQVFPFVHGRKIIETLASVSVEYDTHEHEQEVRDIAIEAMKSAKAINGALKFYQSLAPDKIAIATSGPKKVASTSLEAAGFKLPTVMVCAEDVKFGKPNAEPFLKAAEQLKISTNACIAFEDSAVGIQSAKAAGCVVVALLTSHHEKDLELADYIIRDFNDVKVSVCGTLEINDLLRARKQYNRSESLLARHRQVFNQSMTCPPS